MALYQAKNLSRGTLLTVLTVGATELVLTTGHGVRFPSTTSGQYELTLWSENYGSAADAFNASKAEIVLVTSHNGSSNTIAVVTRARGGTSAIAHAAGAYVDMDFTKTLYDDVLQGRNYKDYARQSLIAPALAPPYDVSSYIGYLLANGQPTAGAVVFLVDRIYCTPHFFKKGAVVYGFKYRKAIAFSQQARIGIYDEGSFDGNWWPGTLLANVVRSTVTDVTPVCTVSETGIPWTCPKDGIYGVATTFDTATQGIGALDVSKTFDNFLGYQMHSSTINGWNTMLTYDQAYGTLPNPFPTVDVTLVLSSDAAPSTPPMLYIIHQAVIS